MKTVTNSETLPTIPTPELAATTGGRGATWRSSDMRGGNWHPFKLVPQKIITEIAEKTFWPMGRGNGGAM